MKKNNISIKQYRFTRLDRTNPQFDICNPKYNRSGFTLIELLIVLATITIINLAIVGFYITVTETSQRGSQSLNRVGFARSAMSLLSKDIRSATGIAPTFREYKTTGTSLILEGEQTYIVYIQDKVSPNILNRIVLNKDGKSAEMSFQIIRDLDSIQFTFDKQNVEQAARVTVALNCEQTQFMQQNILPLTAVTKLRVKY